MHIMPAMTDFQTNFNLPYLSVLITDYWEGQVSVPASGVFVNVSG